MYSLFNCLNQIFMKNDHQLHLVCYRAYQFFIVISHLFPPCPAVCLNKLNSLFATKGVADF